MKPIFFQGLCEAAYQLAAAVHEEKPTAKTGAGSEEVPAPFLYNLDEMSDDDDEGMFDFIQDLYSYIYF